MGLSLNKRLLLLLSRRLGKLGPGIIGSQNEWAQHSGVCTYKCIAKLPSSSSFLELEPIIYVVNSSPKECVGHRPPRTASVLFHTTLKIPSYLV